MYNFEWDRNTGGYRITTRTGMFVACEIRPVFSDELTITGLNTRLVFDTAERRPLLWAKQNVYLYRGEPIAKLNNTRYGEPFDIEWNSDLFGDKTLIEREKTRRKMKLVPVDVDVMVAKNRNIMSALVADTLKRIKEMYDAYACKCDAIYIGFSGGKDSVVLLDLCHKVLPLDVPVVFSDTDMELPDTYRVWEQIQSHYEGRPFLKVSAKTCALENWRLFGPPSQALRWCCSVHKSTPAIIALKERLVMESVKTLAFVGVRGEESRRRSYYDDIGEGLKSQSQVNAMPILSWSAHELWLYIFDNYLVLNEAYRKGLARVGCLMCPMSTDRQNELIRMIYPDKASLFADAVRNSIDREFSSNEDADAFVYNGGWYARKSGVSLKKVISEPGVERKGDRVICEFPIESELAFKEWLKAVGNIEGAKLTIRKDEHRCLLDCVWEDGRVDRSVSKWIVYAIHKAIACVGCRTCEAECPTGALHFEKDINSGKTSIFINETICVHCMRCYSPDEGCLRYFSKRYAGARSMNISGINKYMTFGLKPDWIEILANEGANFRQTTALGNRMIPAAVTWFREAGLIQDSTHITTTLLMEVGSKRGFRDILFWQLLWIRLATTSSLVKWYICHTDFETEYHMKLLDEMLANSVGSPSVRKGAFQSLCQIVKSSPIGEGMEALVETSMKGKAVEILTRRSRSVDPLVVLYGLYVIAEKSGHSAFTVRQMMVAEFDGEFVSPLVAFGLPPDEFKKQCLGLATLYPDFIACSFTLGLDEIRLFPDTKSRDDVVELILQQ